MSLSNSGNNLTPSNSSLEDKKENPLRLSKKQKSAEISQETTSKMN